MANLGPTLADPSGTAPVLLPAVIVAAALAGARRARWLRRHRRAAYAVLGHGQPRHSRCATTPSPISNSERPNPDGSHPMRTHLSRTPTPDPYTVGPLDRIPAVPAWLEARR